MWGEFGEIFIQDVSSFVLSRTLYLKHGPKLGNDVTGDNFLYVDLMQWNYLWDPLFGTGT